MIRCEDGWKGGIKETRAMVFAWFDGAHLSPQLRLYFDRKNEYPSMRTDHASEKL